MPRPARITTPFPSVLETAKRLGVSKHDATVLSELAERFQNSGEFVMPSLRRVGRKARMGRNPVNGEVISIPAKKAVKFRIAKAAKGASVSPKKK
jgi:DNA-binding protein HU-beta